MLRCIRRLYRELSQTPTAYFLINRLIAAVELTIILILIHNLSDIMQTRILKFRAPLRFIESSVVDFGKRASIRKHHFAQTREIREHTFVYFS